MIAAVNQDGGALQFASDDLQIDREIVMSAVNQDGNTIEFASEYLQIFPPTPA